VLAAEVHATMIDDSKNNINAENLNESSSLLLDSV
jgi:hypothetical protein